METAIEKAYDLPDSLSQTTSESSVVILNALSITHRYCLAAMNKVEQTCRPNSMGHESVPFRAEDSHSQVSRITL